MLIKIIGAHGFLSKTELKTKILLFQLIIICQQIPTVYRLLQFIITPQKKGINYVPGSTMDCGLNPFSGILF